MKANERIPAIEVYKELYPNKTADNAPRCIITGTAVKVGPDVFGLPSVEVAESKNASGRALCVLPFMDYLKLRHVKKGDEVEIEGEVRGFAEKYDIAVVKECKILKVNGKELK